MSQMHLRGPLDRSQLRFDPPDVPLDTINRVLGERYGIMGTLRRLEGERDQNTMVTTADGRAFVLKIASPSEDRQVADLQCAALRHVTDADPGIGVPHVVAARDGSPIVETYVDGSPAPTRLVTFLPGTTFESARSMPPADLVGIGEAQGRLALALAGFEHAAASNFLAWSPDAGLLHHPELWDRLSDEGRAAAEPLRNRVESAAAAVAADARLRRQVVHHDGHRGNLLRADEASREVTGVIDFGDLTETFVVSDLAVCVASFTEGHGDPVRAAAAIAAGYDRRMRLSEAEIGVLPDLVLGRIVLGLLLVEFQVRLAPPHRRDEIASELPSYRSNMAVWGSLDATSTAEAVRARVHDERIREQS